MSTAKAKEEEQKEHARDWRIVKIEEKGMCDAGWVAENGACTSAGSDNSRAPSVFQHGPCGVYIDSFMGESFRTSGHHYEVLSHAETADGR